MRYMKLKKLMKVKDVQVNIRCEDCRVYFSPSPDRALELQKKYGYVGLCKECETDMPNQLRIDGN